MELALVKIGGSQGVRLPKTLLELAGKPTKFFVSLKGRCIVLAPEEDDMDAWASAARRLHKEEGDRLVYNDAMDSDHPDWNW